MPNNNTISDGELIRCYLQGDKDCIKILIEKWHITFCKKAFWVLKDSDLAKDVAQETWKLVLANIESLKNPDKFGNWALKIVSNKSIDVLNKKNRERIYLDSYSKEHQVYDDDNQDDTSNNTQLLRAIKDLPIKQQIVLKLFYLETHSLKEIASLLEISIGTAKSRLFHAREKLKTILNNRNYEN